MVAERDSDDAVFRINVLQPEQRQELGAKLLYTQQHEPLTSKYLDRIDPPPFSGKTNDFEEWSARFIWFMQIKSPRVATALETCSYFGHIRSFMSSHLSRFRAVNTFNKQNTWRSSSSLQAGNSSGTFRYAFKVQDWIDRYFPRAQGTASRHGDFFTNASGLRLPVA